MKLYRIKKSNIDRKGRGLYATKNIKADKEIFVDYGNHEFGNQDADVNEELTGEGEAEFQSWLKANGLKGYD